MLVYDLLTSLVIKYISHSIVMTKNMNHNRNDSDYLWTVCDYLISNKKLKQYWMYPEYNVCTEGWISLGEKCSYSEIFWSKRGKLRPRKTPNTGTFQAGYGFVELFYHLYYSLVLRDFFFRSMTFIFISEQTQYIAGNSSNDGQCIGLAQLIWLSTKSPDLTSITHVANFMANVHHGILSQLGSAHFLNIAVELWMEKLVLVIFNMK